MSTKTRLSLKKIRHSLLQLGVEAGQNVMLHASLRTIGRVEGGPRGLLDALLEVLTHDGTLMMLVGSKDAIYDIGDMSEAEKKAALAERNTFDHDKTPANPEWGIVGETLRSLPEAHRSKHPDYSFAAVGRMAKILVADHCYNYCHGPASPLGKLCEYDGKVLLLGAPFQSVSLVHLCEHLALVKGKRVINYEAPVIENGQREFIDIKRFDTRRNIPGYYGKDGYFKSMVEDYLGQGGGKRGEVGQAASYILDAQDFKQFGIFWLESNLPNLKA